MYKPDGHWNLATAEQAVLSITSKDNLPGLTALAHSSVLGVLVRAMFPEASNLRSNDINDRVSNRLRELDVIRAAAKASKDHLPVRSRTELNINTHYFPDSASKVLKKSSLLAVGAGLSSLIPLLYFRDLGLQERNTTIFDKSGRIGGMWVNEPDSRGAQYNNPHITTQWEELNPLLGRTNAVMQSFINKPLSKRVKTRLVNGEVVSVIGEDFGKMVVLKSNKKYGPSNSVLVSLGNEPTKLNTTKMDSNAKEFESEIERNQRPLSEKEARELDGKSILIVGLGNSALAQIRFIESANDKYGVNITPIILTHFTREGINDPNSYHTRADGTIDRLSRDLADGQTTNLELDLIESRDLFERLRGRSRLFQRIDNRALEYLGIQGIVPSVTSWKIERSNEGFNASIQISESHDSIFGGSHKIENIGKIFVLGGYSVDPEKLKTMGIQTDSCGKAIIRPQDGVALRSDGTPDLGIYLTGFVSSDRLYSPSVGTIPGMLARVPYILLSHILYIQSKLLSLHH